MIDKLSIKELPFVDGVPDASQERIRWIRNGECIEGATTKYGHDGNLNAPALGVQTNVVRLEENSIASKDKINELVDNVNLINEALDISTDTAVIQQIEKNRVDILAVDEKASETKKDLGDLTVNFNFLEEDVGYYDPSLDGPYLTVRENINLLKSEIGHYANQDINSQPLPPGETSEATGMKRRIMDNTSAIVDHSQRIDTLEKNYEDSDVGQLGLKLNEIREELGPHIDTVGKQPAYTRISALETAAVNFNESIDSIKTSIGFNKGSIDTRVTTLETKTSTLENTVNNGLVPRVTAVETAIGTADTPTSINGRLGGLRTDVNELKTIVGASSSEGLRFQVSDIDRKIGADVSPAAGTINKRLNDLTTQGNTSASTIQDLQAEIGNNQTGIKGSILKITNQIEGTNPNGSTVEERGLINSVKGLEAQMPTKLGEAPTDGKLYGRKDSAWTEILDGTTEIDAVKASLLVTDGKVSALTARVDTNDASISSLDTRTGALNTSVGEIKADVVLLKSKDTEQDNRITALEESDVTINGKITALETKTDTTDSDVTALALDVSSIESQLTPIKADITKNKGDIVTLTGRVAANEGEITDIKLDTAKIAPLTTRVTTAEGKITTLQSDLAAVKVESDKVEGIDTRLGTSEGKITTLETGLAAVKVESDKVADLGTRLTAAEGKITALETELAKRPPVAPAADGLPYVLVDNAWVLLSDFVTLNSAP
ncbi:fibritin neck whiskers protein [Escherichia phage dhabil]|nr:fibritin neck whiskers protein [Escherichia phage dhabil]